MAKYFVSILILSITLTACSSASDSNEQSPSKVPSTPSNLVESTLDSLAIEATGEALEQMAVPVLPFADNPDPAQCGIPQTWGTNNNQAWLTGYWKGELIQPTVYLYDSHLRNIITAAAEHGTEVQVILFQLNPTLDYYFVKIPNMPSGYNEGWIPEHFLSFEPIEVNQSVPSDATIFG